jgi:hypothetical protein
MNHGQNIRCFAGTLAGLACALLAFASAAPAALASGPEPPVPAYWYKQSYLPPGHVVGSVYKVPVHTVVTGGMPGWQITLIAVGAALIAATVAVLLDRARTARREKQCAAGQALQTHTAVEASERLRRAGMH